MASSSMNPALKWTLIILAIIAILILAYIVLKPKATPPPQGGGGGSNPPAASGNWLTALINTLGPGAANWIFSGGKNDVNTPGSAKYCAAHPEDVANCNSQTDCYNGCSSSRPGYDCNGNLDANC